MTTAGRGNAPQPLSVRFGRSELPEAVAYAQAIVVAMADTGRSGNREPMRGPSHRPS
jgi:hypothetical protein